MSTFTKLLSFAALHAIFAETASYCRFGLAVQQATAIGFPERENTAVDFLRTISVAADIPQIPSPGAAA